MGRVFMAVGRDAADVALTTIFGRNALTKFVVKTEEVRELPNLGTVERTSAPQEAPAIS